MWGPKGLDLDEHRDKVHLSIASLINARTALHAHVDEFLARFLRFRPERVTSEENCRACWVFLQVEPSVVDILCSLDRRWDGGSLSIHASWEGSEEGFSKISGCSLYLLRWSSFSETRWAKVGVCARMFVGSLAAGLDRLWELCMRDEHVSKYNLVGFSKADEGARRLLACAAFAAVPAESLLIQLFEDDRFLRKSGELWGELSLEVECLTDVLPIFVWDRVAAVTRIGLGGRKLRSLALQTTHTIVGYLWQEIFQPLQEYPLLLTQGSPDMQLDTLATLEDVASLDPLTKKARALLDMGVSRSRIARAIVLMREVPGTTTLIEQNHAAAALVLRHHETYTLPTLCARSLMHQARHLVGPTHHEPRCARIEADIAKFKHKLRSKLSARNMFLRGLFRQAAQRDDGSGAFAFQRKKEVLCSHGAHFNALRPSSKRQLELAAVEENRRRAAALEEERSLLQERLDLEQQRASQEHMANGVVNHSDSFRFSAALLQKMCAQWAPMGVGRASMSALMSRKPSAPQCPSVQEQQAFLAMEAGYTFSSPAALGGAGRFARTETTSATPRSSRILAASP